MKVRALFGSLTAIALSLFFCSTTTLANGWIAEGRITQVYPHATYDEIFIKHTEQMNLDACAHESWLALEKSSVMYKEIYSLLLAASLADAEVSIFLSGCSAAGYPAIRNVLMLR